MARRRDKGQEKRAAAARVRSLLARAADEARGPDADLADRYADLATSISKRYQLRMGQEARIQVCRSCGRYRRAGAGVRVRLHRGRLITTCNACGALHRRPLRTRRATAETP